MWMHECMDEWGHGCIDVLMYMHGCMGAWVYVCVGVWVHGCVWVYGRVCCSLAAIARAQIAQELAAQPALALRSIKVRTRVHARVGVVVIMLASTLFFYCGDNWQHPVVVL